MNINLPFELINYRHLSSQKNGKQYTIVEGVVDLGEGRRSVMEAFMEGTHHYQAGNFVAKVSIGVNFQRRLEARINAIEPVQRRATAVPATA